MSRIQHTILLAAIAAAAAALAPSCARGPRDGEHTLHILSTNDVHGTWFDSTYTGGRALKSLFAMNHYIDSVRAAVGAGNVVLVDAGDCLQGDNATYYYNYVDTLTPHPFARLLGYMKYDAVAVGNHDIEAGHPVYDRVAADLDKNGAPFLAGNAIRLDDGRPYFPLYKMVRRAGLRVAILGYTNANIRAWVTEEQFTGMTFDPIVKSVQADVDAVRAKEKPDVVVVAMHSACGQGDGTVLEAEALDVFNSVRGVDFLVCGHDHRPYVETRDTTALLNSGSHSRYVAHGTLSLQAKGGKVVSRKFATELIPVSAHQADPVMREAFRKEFEAVKAFTTAPIGTLGTELRSRDAYAGMCTYVDLIHTVCLGCAPAQISIAAPLTYDGTVGKGTLCNNDLFTIYPFENQLFVVRLTGAQLKDYLEVSYDKWIRTVSSSADHVLRIRQYDDQRTRRTGWTFEERAYNFDSAAGIRYTVDVTKPRGQRISISGMADGSAFDPTETYNVAMTSYRASGGGGLLKEAGIDPDRIQDITVGRYPEIRELVYRFIVQNGDIDTETISDPATIGGWRFVPERVAEPALGRDMQLLFPGWTPVK